MSSTSRQAEKKREWNERQRELGRKNIAGRLSPDATKALANLQDVLGWKQFQVIDFALVALESHRELLAEGQASQTISPEATARERHRDTTLNGIAATIQDHERRLQALEGSSHVTTSRGAPADPSQCELEAAARPVEDNPPVEVPSVSAPELKDEQPALVGEDQAARAAEGTEDVGTTSPGLITLTGDFDSIHDQATKYPDNTELSVQGNTIAVLTLRRVKLLKDIADKKKTASDCRDIFEKLDFADKAGDEYVAFLEEHKWLLG